MLVHTETWPSQRPAVVKHHSGIAHGATDKLRDQWTSVLRHAPTVAAVTKRCRGRSATKVQCTRAVNHRPGSVAGTSEQVATRSAQLDGIAPRGPDG